LWSNRRLKHQTLFSDGGLRPSLWRCGDGCRCDSARLGGHGRPQEQHCNRISLLRALRRFHGRQAIFSPRTPQDDGHECIQHVTTEHTNAAAAMFSTDLTNGSITSRQGTSNRPFRGRSSVRRCSSPVGNTRSDLRRGLEGPDFRSPVRALRRTPRNADAVAQLTVPIEPLFDRALGYHRVSRQSCRRLATRRLACLLGPGADRPVPSPAAAQLTCAGAGQERDRSRRPCRQAPRRRAGP
jgi:hypothetical protein